MRAYLLLVGVLIAASNIWGAIRVQSTIAVATAVVSVGVAVVYVYLGLMLPSLVVKAPLRARQLLLAGGALILIAAVMNAMTSWSLAGIQALAGIAIVSYLYVNIGRLSAEAAQKAGRAQGKA
jgi:peptidoglycan/LPS O-acetylase OafA/YrhL